MSKSLQGTKNPTRFSRGSVKQANAACVVNVKHHEYDIYIGRKNSTYGVPQSKWHNRFVVGKDGTLADVLQKFEADYLANAELRSQISELRDKRIACWCCGKNEVLTADDPIKCHGQILLKDLRGDYLDENMATRTKAISDEVLEVLSKSIAVSDQQVRIVGTVDRKLYVKVSEALESIGGSWKSGKVKAHVFPDGKDPAALIAELLGSEKLTLQPKNPLAFFATSKPLAQRMIKLLAKYAPECLDGTLVEPEAGEGGIADEVPDTAKLILVELDEFRVGVLQKKGYAPIHADFLTLPLPDELVDGCVMNPPFTIDGSTTVYIDHIQRAERWVRDGGALCAIAPGSFASSTNAKVKAFRDHVEALGEWKPLEDGAFKAAGTNVSAVILAYRVQRSTPELQDAPLAVGVEQRDVAIATGSFSTPAGDIDIQVFAGSDGALRFEFRGAMIDPATYPNGEVVQWLHPSDLDDTDDFPDEAEIAQYAQLAAENHCKRFLMDLDDLSIKLRSLLASRLKTVNPTVALSLIFNRGDLVPIGRDVLASIPANGRSEPFRVLALQKAAWDELTELGVEVACDRLWNQHLPASQQRDASDLAAMVQVGAAMGEVEVNGQAGHLFAVGAKPAAKTEVVFQGSLF